MSEEKASSPSGKMGDEEKPVSGAKRRAWGSPWYPAAVPGGDEKKEAAGIVWGGGTDVERWNSWRSQSLLRGEIVHS